MIKETYDDGSFSEHYENGDIVEIVNEQRYGLGAKVGEWGRVWLTSLQDKERGHTSLTSFICITTAGVSTPKDSFQQRISSVAVWDVRLKQSQDS